MNVSIVSMGYIGTRFNIPGVHSAYVQYIPLGKFETGVCIYKLGSIYPRGYIEPRLNIPYVGSMLNIQGGILDRGGMLDLLQQHNSKKNALIDFNNCWCT